MKITQENAGTDTNIEQQLENKGETNGLEKRDEVEKQEYREEVKSSFGIKRYRIQEVIKPGQVVLIQVLKEEEVKKVQR